MSFQPPTLKKSLVEAYIILVRVLALSGALRQAEHSRAQNGLAHGDAAGLPTQLPANKQRRLMLRNLMRAPADKLVPMQTP